MTDGRIEQIWPAGGPIPPEDHDPEPYRQLSEADARVLAERASQVLEAHPADGPTLDDDRVNATAIVMRVACVAPEALEGLHDRLFDATLDYAGFTRRQGMAFARATDATRDRLAALVASGTEWPVVGRAVDALAFMDDETVPRLFARWQQDPPGLFAHWGEDPADPQRLLAHHAWDAGWELTADGQRRRLYRSASRILRFTSEDAADPTAPVASGDAQVAVPAEEGCPWCGTPLLYLLDLPLSRPEWTFLDETRERLRVPTCVYCGCYSDIYADVTASGDARWSASTSRPDYLPDHSREGWPSWMDGGTVVAHAGRTPFEPLLTGDESTHVGGLGGWIQGGHHPPCPSCGRSMPFVGQVAMQDVGGDEGIYYAYYDADCGVTASHYQQS